MELDYIEEYYLSKLGHLKIKEIYVYYDFPRFFLAENKTNNKFLGLSIEENDEYERWFYLPISLDRLNSLKNKILTINRAFKESEDAFLWDVKIFYEKTDPIIEIINCDEIAENLLPKPNKYLNYSDDKKNNQYDDLKSLSHSRAREIIDVVLNKGNDKHEIESEFLAKTLLNVQSLIRYMSIKDNKAKMSDSQRNKTKMMVTTTFEGSFGIRLESTEQQLSLFDINSISDYSRDLGDTLNLMLELFDPQSDYKKIHEIFNEINPFARSKYKLLLTQLKEAKLDIGINFGSYKYNTSKNSYLSYTNIKSILNSLKKQNLKDTYTDSFVGYLIGGNLDNNNFEFSVINDKAIKGKISKLFTRKSLNLSKDEPCKIEAEIEIKINDITQDEELIYTLVSINKISKEELNKLLGKNNI